MMEASGKRHPFLPTLALLFAFMPAVVAAVLVALSAGGNWAFLILALMASPITEAVFGGASLVLGILSVRKDWGRRRGMAAVILSSVGLALTVVVYGTFGIRGLLI